jgi:F-type H+-transporting ATPase subunit delta
MAKSKASAKRHAQAVFQIAQERNELDEWQEYLALMKTRLEEPTILAFLKNSKIPFGEKTKLLQQLFPELNPLAMNFCQLLVAKNRLYLIEDVLTEYQHLVDEYQGRVRVRLISAVPLDKDEEQRIQAKLSETLDKEVVLNIEINPQIIGGIIFRIEDKLIDGSVHTRLETLRRNLTQTGMEVR